MPTSKKKTAKKEEPWPVLRGIEATVCHAVLQGRTDEQIIEQLGLDTNSLAMYLARPAVKKYLERYQGVFATEFAKHEAWKLLKKGVTREFIAEQYVSLAMLPPERTRGSINGQVQALAELSSLLGLKLDMQKLAEMLRQMPDGALRTAAGAKQEGIPERVQ